MLTPRIVLVHGDSILEDETLEAGMESDVMQRLLMQMRTATPLAPIGDPTSLQAGERE